MTPLEIEVLLHCFVSPDPHPRLYAPAVREAIERFVKLGCLRPIPLSTPEIERWIATDKGRKLVEALQAVEPVEPMAGDGSSDWQWQWQELELDDAGQVDVAAYRFIRPIVTLNPDTCGVTVSIEASKGLGPSHDQDEDDDLLQAVLDELAEAEAMVLRGSLAELELTSELWGLFGNNAARVDVLALSRMTRGELETLYRRLTGLVPSGLWTDEMLEAYVLHEAYRQHLKHDGYYVLVGERRGVTS